ncbi:MAG: roadblock/LC7 domain-containing protein [Promethearchaeota archaeon]
MISFEDDLISALMKIEGVLMCLVCSPQGRVIKSAMAQEFNQNKLGVQSSMIKNLVKEVSEETGLQDPDFTLVHCPGFYIAYIYIESKEEILFTIFVETVDMTLIFDTVNSLLGL